MATVAVSEVNWPIPACFTDDTETGIVKDADSNPIATYLHQGDYVSIYIPHDDTDVHVGDYQLSTNTVFDPNGNEVAILRQGIIQKVNAFIFYGQIRYEGSSNEFNIMMGAVVATAVLLDLLKG